MKRPYLLLNLSLPGANRVRRDSESAGSLPARLMPKLLNEEDLEMRTNFDFTPYRRSTVGFDRLFNMKAREILYNCPIWEV